MSASRAAWTRVARPPGEGLRVAGTAGVHREFAGVWALTGSVGVELPVDRFVLGLTPSVERRLDPEADAVDLMLPMAAGVALGKGLRLGAEAVGQDLEDYLEGEEEEAEGGAVWIAAATAGWSGEQLDLALAPGVGVGPQGAGFVARLRAAWRF